MAKIVKPLTNTQVSQAKPNGKIQNLTDGGGLYLHISKAGTKAWRIDFTTPVTKKRVTMTLGQYPEITLAAARQMRADVKYHLANGDDPRTIKRDNERQQLLESNNTFAMIAEEYISRQTHLSEATHKNNRRYAEYLNKSIGGMPISSIKPIDVLDACRPVESKGYLETALKMKSLAGQVFRYGVQTAKCERDVTQDLKGALKQPPTKHYAAITDPIEFGAMLRSLEDYNGSFEVKCALKLMPLLFVRSGEMRYAMWSDFDFDKRTWTFTPRKTKRKTGISLIVPLPDQAMDILTELIKHKRSEFVFPAIHTTVQPMSENTLSQALKRLGIDGDTHTIHGFRASARTMIVERLKYQEKYIEMQLGHRVPDLHGRAYNRAQFLDERREMLQDWADYLDKLKA
ncbi:integrase arm-type DNA-binding domain-containing protein [Psychrobacter sp. BI730]|uniref:tyrosine-type recombinase/integrase n=1 Tax=Psychrobacter sp. BI730 TaxID=2705463 RepID=UPI0015C8C93B|nr:integrase arm-type DNA-binding domain-containing protein [Psychrobacter sp. BI730]NYR10117.1 integrase arm-type DNA-binding domain-containing protein [Psychrobacter sp. BI730]